MADDDRAVDAGGPVEAQYGCVAAELRGDGQIGMEFRYGRGGVIEQFAARRADPFDGFHRCVDGSAVRVGGVDDVQGAPPPCCFGRGPQGCPACGVRPVDADDDRPEFRTGSDAFHGFS